MNNSNDFNNTHEHVYSILPWWVNKTLPEDQHQRASGHIKDCAICQQEIQLLGVVNQNISEAAELAYSKHADLTQDLATVVNRVSSSSSTTPNSTQTESVLQKIINNLAQLLDNRPPAQWLAATLGAVLVITLGIQLIVVDRQPTDEYTVLESPVQTDEQMQLLIHLATTADDDIEQIVLPYTKDLKVTLTRQTDGSYLLTTPASISVDQLNSVLLNLQQDKAIEEVELLP